MYADYLLETPSGYISNLICSGEKVYADYLLETPSGYISN